MRINQQQIKALREHNVYAYEICDKCHKVLNHIRFTFKDQSGVWCSRECRDGKEAAERYLATRRNLSKRASQTKQ